MRVEQGTRRVEATWNLLSYALHKAVGLATQEVDISAEASLADAGLVLVEQSRFQAALDLDRGEPAARAYTLRVVLAEMPRWQRWREQHQRLSVYDSPLKEVVDTIAQVVTQGKAPGPTGGPGD